MFMGVGQNEKGLVGQTGIGDLGSWSLGSIWVLIVWWSSACMVGPQNPMLYLW